MKIKNNMLSGGFKLRFPATIFKIYATVNGKTNYYILPDEFSLKHSITLGVPFNLFLLVEIFTV